MSCDQPVDLPEPTAWTTLLDEVEIAVFGSDSGEPADGWHQLRLTRERYAFRVVRVLGEDDLPTIVGIIARTLPRAMKMPVLAPGETGPTELLASIADARNTRLMKLWHLLSAPLGQAGTPTH